MLALECEAVHISTIFVAWFRRPALGPDWLPGFAERHFVGKPFFSRAALRRA
jgi:hypothetical protein